MRATGRARVSTQAPRAFAVCDNCGFWYNHVNLVAERQWQGNELVKTGFLVCTVRCLDRPQPQLQTPILPADPYPVINPRPELYNGDNGFDLCSSTDPTSSQTPVDGLP